MTREISTLLVANRGEIALRVMRTAKALGMRTVAVFSEADRDAPHVRFADQAVALGPSPAGESYLRADRVLGAAQESGADAIHPGYGFLSENAAFAQAVETAGLIFVGPSAHAIDVMGDKARAKRAMLKAGVPCIPGYQGEDQSEETLRAQAQSIGFPLMVKAAAGGGGRGMRLVHAAAGLSDALGLARSEAENAFGSGTLILERAIIQPRHVEVQVFADAQGNAIHLGERDCSVQRRHQKVIEGAPCPVMTEALRAEMGAAAVEAARAVDYRGAGTVEFLLDASGAFYFLEMNTRLQVEHPVTEAITGLDLVALQLRVAAGLPLGLSQSDVSLSGHSIEVRLYAEDPDNDFLPSTGPVALFPTPKAAGIRVDAGIETGGEVSPFYDPMVAKIIATGADREQARRRLVRALQSSALLGPRSNRDFLLDALQRPVFAAGEATTAFIAETYGEAGFQAQPPSFEAQALAASLFYCHRRGQAQAAALDLSDELLDWSSDGRLPSVFVLGEEGARVHLRPQRDGTLALTDGAEACAVIDVLSYGAFEARLSVNGTVHDCLFHHSDPATLHLSTAQQTYLFTERSLTSAADDVGGSGRITAPMHGRLVSIDVGVGDQVAQGQRLAVLEAMKMQHEILAPASGTVETIAAQADSQIAADDLILDITPAD